MPSVLASPFLPSVSSSTLPSSAMRISSALIASPLQSSSLAAALSSVKSPIAPKSAASSIPTRRPVSALLRECLARWNTEFAELDETFFAREKRVLELKSFLAKSISREPTIRS